jgi:hypothetical protein
MKNKKYHTVGTFPKSNIKTVERDKMDTPSKHMYMTDHFLDIYAIIKNYMILEKKLNVVFLRVKILIFNLFLEYTCK